MEATRDCCQCYCLQISGDGIRSSGDLRRILLKTKAFRVVPRGTKGPIVARSMILCNVSGNLLMAVRRICV